MNSLEELSHIQWLDSMSKFQLWYDKNKQALNARRKHKYHSDPAYREKVLASQQERNRVKVEQRQYKTTISGQVVRAYSIGEASQLIRRSAQTLTQWERRGLIPLPIFPAPRSYTHHQVMLIRELVYIVTKAYARRVSNGKVQAEIAAQQAKIFAQWDEIPDSIKS